MPQYDNNNSGVLFKNDRKETERHPDYKGSAEVDGVEYWLSCWIKTRKDNSGKFLSLAFDKKEGQSSSSATADVPIDTAGIDDDIPFLWNGPAFDADDAKVHANR